MSGIRVNIVRAEAGFHQLSSSVTFIDSPLTGAKHTNRFWPFFFQHRLPFFGHDIEGLIPANRGKIPFFIVFAVLHSQQRLSQAIVTVHDLR